MLSPSCPSARSLTPHSMMLSSVRGLKSEYKKSSSDVIISAVSPMAGVLTGGCVVPAQPPCARLVYIPTGPLDRGYDDLRRFA